MPLPRFKVLLLALPLLVGCVSARMRDHEADQLFREGRFPEAAKVLKSRLKENGPGSPGSEDELLYLLDAGLSLHQAGLHDESNAFFALAEKHVGLNGYTSVSEEAGTLLTGENTKTYRGEAFEKVLIHVYKALNYAAEGRTEEALVEARLVNRRLEDLKRDDEPPYQQNAFARYLSAILYEAEGEYNDAYIDYQKTFELEPSFTDVGRDLWRIARALGMRDQMERWQEKFQLSGSDLDPSKNRILSARSGKAEIVVIYQNGISPIKVPDPAFPSLPVFRSRNNPVSEAEVDVDGVLVGRPRKLHDVEATAIAHLERRKAAMLAKRVAGRVTKALLADQVRRRTRNEGLGLLVEVILVASDQADTRSWSLLPHDLQILRVSVDAGLHEVRVRPLGGAALPSRTVDVQPGKKVFLSFRYLP